MKFELDINNVNYIKIFYKDINGVSHCIKAILKQMGEKEIIAYAKSDNIPKAETPQDITVSFACDDGLYKTGARLKYISTVYEENPYVYFTIQTPEGVDYQQIREYFRVRMFEKALMSYKDENENIQRIECKTYDISANGIRLQFEQPLKIFKNVQIKIFFETRTIQTNAILIRTDYDGNIFRASFKYDRISERDMDYISQMCIKRQLELKRNQLPE